LVILTGLKCYNNAKVIVLKMIILDLFFPGFILILSHHVLFVGYVEWILCFVRRDLLLSKRTSYIRS
jgi:hypothetical protein